VHPVNRHEKAQLLAHLIGHNRWQQVLVFTRTKHGADKLARSLEADGIRAAALHGNKTQGARTKALAEFKRSAVEVLVATDIAARGIDIDQLPHVVNYDLPNVPQDYVHRIGRTGRAGAAGEAISLVCVDEHVFLRDIERLIKRSIVREVVPGFEPDPHAVAQPVFAKRNGRPAPSQERRPMPATSRGQHRHTAGAARQDPGQRHNASGDLRRRNGEPPRDHAPAHSRKQAANGDGRKSGNRSYSAPPRNRARAAGR
jgi:ATP-dependent RNA helicase RhlE